MNTSIFPRALVYASAVFSFFPGMIRAQTAPPPSSVNDEIVIMSPFEVTTDQDRGYRATNSTGGTRLDARIRDLPMPIEVITGEFIQDTGATDLRQSLRYSSGILLQTQNDYGAPAGSFSNNPGKINNPEGQTASPDQTHMKIRGFETESVLRNGFRRQNSTDSINIERVEIARGPASLLYGVGNFGGVVNYISKAPNFKRSEAEFGLAVGSYDFIRGTIDLSGPITKNGTLAYRLTGAVQATESYTDFNSEDHYFVSPVISYRPFKYTEITLDVEYGKQDFSGIGWQDLRAAVSGFVNDSNGYNANFYDIPGRDEREFRWSGPDTYRDTKASNIEFTVKQRILPGLHLLAGANLSKFSFTQLDNLAAFTRVDAGSSVPAWAVAPVTFAGLKSGQTGLPAGPQPTTISYQWENRDDDHTHKQGRVELTYNLKLFQDRSKWLRMDHSFLAGFNYTEETVEYHTRQTPGDVSNYHSPANYDYIRYGHMADGSLDHPLVEWDNSKSTTSNPALYAVYQGKFLDDRVTLIFGARRDRSWNEVWNDNPEYRANGTPTGNYAGPVTTRSTPSKDTTYQYGVSVAVTRELSLYGMHSEGVEPNYQGKLDFYGKPLLAALAKNDEFGIKFDFFKGRLSGTISKFKITRERAQVGGSSAVWFAPVVGAKLNYNPSRPIVYNVNDFNPANGGATATALQTTPQWNAAVTAGSIYQATNSTGSTNWYVNASTPAGAAYLDTLFANAIANNYDWWGWLYNGVDSGGTFDNLTNSATMDGNGRQNSVATGSDQAKGWDAQVIISPIDNLQIMLSWSHVEKVVLNAQAWARYPYPEDRWAIWYAPYTFSASAGRPLNEVYTDPTDTSTYIAFGTGLPMDDTPEDQGTFWINYTFPKKTHLEGFSVGFGGWYESPRNIYPAYGQNALDQDGNTIFLETRSRYQFNAMLKYAFKHRGHDASIQLNVDNVLNDRKLYGWIYAAPMRWQFTFNYAL